MLHFTIAAAQAGSLKGDIAGNVQRHVELAAIAGKQGAGVVVFPELSLSGYELTIAAEVAIDAADSRLEPLKQFCDEANMVVMAGCPLRSGEARPYIGMLIWQPGRAVTVYRKRFVHSSEEPYFVAADDTVVFEVGGVTIGAAICADISNPQHAADAARAGAKIYAAGVAKTPDDMARAEASMAAYARAYGMLAVLANHATATGGNETGGRSAIWNETGQVIARAEPQGECIVLARATPNGWLGEVKKHSP
jgi:predicted amidohydrolase